MNLHLESLALGFALASVMAVAWMMGRNSARREARRIVRHGRNLDLVWFEDAEADPTIDVPKPASASVAPLHLESQR